MKPITIEEFKTHLTFKPYSSYYNVSKLKNKLFLVKTEKAFFFFSYYTCIGIMYENKTILTDKTYSTTTKKHKQYIIENYNAVIENEALLDELIRKCY